MDKQLIIYTLQTTVFTVVLSLLIDGALRITMESIELSEIEVDTIEKDVDQVIPLHIENIEETPELSKKRKKNNTSETTFVAMKPAASASMRRTIFANYPKNQRMKASHISAFSQSQEESFMGCLGRICLDKTFLLPVS